MESLKTWREPVAWLLMALLVANLALVLVTVLGTDPRWSQGYATAAAFRVADPLLMVLLAGAVAWAVVVDPVPRAAALAATATALGGVLVVSGIAATAYGLTAPVRVVEALTPVIGLAVSALAVAVLARLTRLARADRSALPTAVTPPALESSPASPPTPEPEPDPQLQPTWQPDAAAGAAWTTAGEAAAGAPAAGWGSAAPEFSGWRALPAGETPTEPTGPDPRDRAPDDGRPPVG